MEVTGLTRKRLLRALTALLALVIAALAFTAGATAASADEVGEEYDFSVGGFVRNDGDPLDGVAIAVSGPGYEADTVTDADGAWKIGVPEKGTWTVTLDESTLPEGVIVTDVGNVVEVEIDAVPNKIYNFLLGAGVRETTSFFDQFVQRVFTGLAFGLLLALAAIGASLVFGTTGLNNFAHAEMVTFGALAALTLSVDLAWPIGLAIVAAIALSGLFGWTVDAALWKPLRKRGVGLIPMMIVSIGLSLAVRYIYQYIYGGSTRQLPGADGADLKFGPISLSPLDLLSMGISIVVLIAVAFFLLRTRIGKATRAVSDNPSLAAASGIDVDRVIRIVWVIAGALAGLSGILYAFYRPGVSWDMGFQILLLIFAAITLGGLGTAFGALIGSLVVGLFIEISTLWIPSDLKYVGALVILILVLLVRPQGILGRKERIG